VTLRHTDHSHAVHGDHGHGHVHVHGRIDSSIVRSLVILRITWQSFRTVRAELVPDDE
jgi:hypothetical protein